MEKELPYKIYEEVYNSTLIDFLMTMFNQEIQDNYNITAIVKNGDQWIIKLERHFLPSRPKLEP